MFLIIWKKCGSYLIFVLSNVDYLNLNEMLKSVLQLILRINTKRYWNYNVSGLVRKQNVLSKGSPQPSMLAYRKNNVDEDSV